MKKRTYVCFVDFARAFDTIRRDLLYLKLQTLGIPFELCLLLQFIYSNLKFFIRSGSYMASSFTSFIGLPQGDNLSPILFNLFVHDLPACFEHTGPVINGFGLAYLMFADDLAIICESANELQTALNKLNDYCTKNYLKINTAKTKCLIFHHGRLPECSFTLNGEQLEIVNSFEYLCFTFSPQLPFTKHVQALVTKANSRCGILRSRLPINNLSIELVLSTFACYIIPIFRYGLPLWLNATSNSAKQSVNAVLTKFLKSYLCIPFHANDVITHFVTNTQPLLRTLEFMALECTSSFVFPEELHGHSLSFLVNLVQPPSYNVIPEIPTFFWRSKSFCNIPTNALFRKKLCREIFDIDHVLFCERANFHGLDRTECICIGCRENMGYYHQQICSAYES